MSQELYISFLIHVTDPFFQPFMLNMMTQKVKENEGIAHMSISFLSKANGRECCKMHANQEVKQKQKQLH